MKSYIVALLIICTIPIYAQDYTRGFGVRVGYTSAIAFKKFYNDVSAMELLMSFQRGGAQLYFMRQFHYPIFLQRTNQLFCYIGFGAHVGYSYYSNDKFIYNGYSYRRRENSFGMGADGSIGLEYHAQNYPYVIGIDYKPFMEINFPQYFRYKYLDIAFTFKYAFM